MSNLFYFSPHQDSSIPDGAIKRSSEIFKYLCPHFARSVLIQRNGVILFQKEKTKWKFFTFFISSKPLSAVLSFVFNVHYLKSKHLGIVPRFLTYILHLFIPFNVYYVHFLWSYLFLKPFVQNKKVFLDTHNFDYDWWDNLSKNNSSILAKRICYISKSYIQKTIKSIGPNVILIHATPNDCRKYRVLLPHNTHLIVNNGCNISIRKKAPNYKTGTKKIYFLGSLNVQMSLDSLRYFEKVFWPFISDICTFHVVGKGFSSYVNALCTKNCWYLKQNLEDQELQSFISQMHYLVLPFQYSCGSKLKFIEACALGIPVISTAAGVSGFKNLPSTVFIFNNPKLWRRQLIGGFKPKKSDILSCIFFASLYSWKKQTLPLSSFL